MVIIERVAESYYIWRIFQIPFQNAVPFRSNKHRREFTMIRVTRGLKGSQQP